jgi:hypothetical protein
VIALEMNFFFIKHSPEKLIREKDINHPFRKLIKPSIKKRRKKIDRTITVASFGNVGII